ncbi:MAG: magnesium chelatase subunit D [Pseudomonadota bacterium]
MSAPGTPDPLDDALIAARLFATNPHLFGGMVISGAGPARDALLHTIGEAIPCRRLPSHIDDTRLMGGIDIVASLSAGKPVEQTGLIEEAAGGALVLPMAERCEVALAGRLSQALDSETAALILLDDGAEEEDAPPQSLSERLAFHCDLTQSRVHEGVALPPRERLALSKVAPLDTDTMAALGSTAAALGISGIRPLLFAGHAARAHAALGGRKTVADDDLKAAIRLVLSPRATQIPQVSEEEQPPEPPPPPPENPGDNPRDNDQQQRDGPPDDMLVEAALAAIPADLLAQLASGNAPRRSGGSGSGQKKKSGLRGKPLGARPGMPRGGARLALIDTLRAAVPWQEARRRDRPDTISAIQIRKDDLRIRRFEEKSARVTIFAVDASGSAAAARLAEAKGAVELMLSQAYVTRSEVALIAFRGESAELLLPPTRSLTRARRALAELPGGGGTPLAMGLNAARDVAEQVIARGRTASVVVLTDGRANIDANGEPGRKQAGEDAEAAAKAIARAGIEALVVDIAPRPGREGPQLAKAMSARFLALPRADAKALHAAIDAVAPSREPV